MKTRTGTVAKNSKGEKLRSKPAAPASRPMKSAKATAPARVVRDAASAKKVVKKVAAAAPARSAKSAGPVKKSSAFAHLPSADSMGLEPIKTKYTRTMMLEEMAESADISLKQAKIALTTFEDILACHLCGGGAGVFVLPGMFKATVRIKPAVKGGKEAINPFTKEPYITKDRPASKVLKLLPLKGLKDAVATK